MHRAWIVSDCSKRPNNRKPHAGIANKTLSALVKFTLRLELRTRHSARFTKNIWSNQSFPYCMLPGYQMGTGKYSCYTGRTDCWQPVSGRYPETGKQGKKRHCLFIKSRYTPRPRTVGFLCNRRTYRNSGKCVCLLYETTVFGNKQRHFTFCSNRFYWFLHSLSWRA